jgi:hypothetical protein
MHDLSPILSDIEAFLAQCNQSHFIVENPHHFSIKKIRAPIKKQAPQFDVKPTIVLPNVTKKVAKIPSPKTQIVKTETSRFKGLIQSIDPNFAFSDQACALTTIVLLYCDSEQQEILSLLKSKITPIFSDVSIIELDADSMADLSKGSRVKLIVALDSVLENILLKPKIKVFSGKILKKLGKTALLTIKADEGIERIKMCIERLKL